MSGHKAEFESLAGAHVLIVDEHPRSANLIATVLEYCGATTTISSKEEALRLLGAVIPHVLVVAVPMSAADGAAFMRAAQALAAQAGQELPALALSADRTDGARASAMTAGFDDCLLKPVDAGELSRVVGRLVRTGDQRSRSFSIRRALPS